MEFVPLASLHANAGSVPVRVRVSRSWEATNINNGDLITFDLIVIDSEGTPMWVQVKNTLARRFKALLTVGCVYSLKFFGVVAVGGLYRPVSTPVKILFRVTTAVIPITVPAPDIPRHAFQFVSNAQVVDRSGDPTHLSDIVGHLLSIGEVEAVSGTRVKRDLECLTEVAGKVRVTLWADYARLFVTAHKLDTLTGPVVVVLTSLKITQYSGAYTFSATCGTQCFPNLDHPAVSRLLGKLDSTAAPIAFIGRSPGVPATTAEAMAENRMFIATIMEGGWVDEKEGYKITFFGRIDEVLTKYGWYYLGCPNCHRKVITAEGSYTCPKCPGLIPFLEILYKVNFVVRDGPDTLNCTAMNKVAERMVDSCAKKIFNKAAAGDISFPKPILDLCGQEYIFKIGLTSHNLESGQDSFTVVDVFTPEFKVSKITNSSSPATPSKIAAKKSRRGKEPAIDNQDEVCLTPEKRRRPDPVSSDDDDA